MSSSGESANFASSMTDLMTSLAVIFVLLLVASLNNIRQEQENAVTSIHVILDEVLAEFRRIGVEVQRDEKDPLVLLVIVPEDLFRFAFDRADIPAQGIVFLQEFAPKLVGQVCKEDLRERISSIIVEGHADYRGTDKANFDRSQQRASAVVIETLQTLGHSNLSDEARLAECFKDLVSASGRGNAEPILDSEGKPDPDRSRRVIFKIRVRSLEQELTTIFGYTPSLPTRAQ
ncbi:MAG: OmpA family protein [Acidobacteriota bacterium]